MKPVHFRPIGIPILACGLCLAGAQHPDKDGTGAASMQSTQSPANAQSSSKPKPDKQSRIQKVANPLNDLLDEAQRDIDNKNFEAAITPLQKVIAPRNPSRRCCVSIPMTSPPSITWDGARFVRASLKKRKQDSGTRWKFSQMGRKRAGDWRGAWTRRKNQKQPPLTAIISKSRPAIPRRAPGWSIF